MLLKKISIKNLCSFQDFTNDTDFNKCNILFGTNGSGKSTVTDLLYLLNEYLHNKGTDSETRLKTFFQRRFSKETQSAVASVSLDFSSNSGVSIEYHKNNNHISVAGNTWTPIKVFNEQYTARTISESFQMNLRESGILIGEVNIQLDLAHKQKEKLTTQLTAKIIEAEKIVKHTVNNFRKIADSTLNVDSIISVENLLADSCEFQSNASLIKQRKGLGYGTRPTSSLSLLDEQQVKFRIRLEDIEKKCKEIVQSPNIKDEVAEVLRNYSTFFAQGVEIVEEKSEEKCPFCLRNWPNINEKIDEYRSFLTSTYNKKRQEIKNIIDEIKRYQDQIVRQREITESRRQIASTEAEPYGVSISEWKDLGYNLSLHNTIIELLQQKFDKMEQPISVLSSIEALQNSHSVIIRGNNNIIKDILKEIDQVSARRKALNLKLAHHYAKQMWMDNSVLRQDIHSLKDLIIKTEKEIISLEEKTQQQDTVREIFNGLLNYIGICEYSIGEDKKLYLDLDKSYDITNEGVRISTSQRKILSLCYFFAEIISESDKISNLKKYILVFDDPVDSADYIYFHSITSVIEKAEDIIAKILKKDSIKIGQFFVFTHNSLLHDRLSASKWANYCRSIKKANGVTTLARTGKTINNYCEYIDAVCNYYINPTKQKKQMIYIGNVIRRILEILASFNTLRTNNFNDILDGMGKHRLALLANHLSHESFTKVLNPFSNSEELREACRDLLEVIKDHHPKQYKTILERYKIELSS